MRDPRINFRNRELAALLAFLIPGAGHFYQGRRLKAGIYCTGILSLFFAGMVLGDWQPVYSQVAYATRPVPLQMQEPEDKVGVNYSIGYGAQVFVGLPAIPSLIQQVRFGSDDGLVTSVKSDIKSDFSGIMIQSASTVPVSGQLELSAGTRGDGVGKFVGKARNGREVSVPIDGQVNIGRQVFGSPRRQIAVRSLNGDDTELVEFHGTISRPFLDWYQAPRDNAELDRLHGKLSQNYDIACVFTWIAGLLNLMAIWDAYDGPAYGYGDEKPDEDEEDADAKGKEKKAAAS